MISSQFAAQRAAQTIEKNIGKFTAPFSTRATKENLSITSIPELRENRSESIASIASFTESEFASGSPSPVDKVNFYIFKK